MRKDYNNDSSCQYNKSSRLKRINASALREMPIRDARSLNFKHCNLGPATEPDVHVEVSDPRIYIERPCMRLVHAQLIFPHPKRNDQRAVPWQAHLSSM